MAPLTPHGAVFYIYLQVYCFLVYSSLASPFHRLARGLEPTLCPTPTERKRKDRKKGVDLPTALVCRAFTRIGKARQARYGLASGTAALPFARGSPGGPVLVGGGRCRASGALFGAASCSGVCGSPVEKAGFYPDQMPLCREKILEALSVGSQGPWLSVMEEALKQTICPDAHPPLNGCDETLALHKAG